MLLFQVRMILLCFMLLILMMIIKYKPALQEGVPSAK